MASQQFQITNGPGVGELVDAFKYAFHKHHTHTATFTSSLNMSIVLTVTGLSYESGSYGMFLIEGCSGVLGRVKGFYNANKREGFLEETD